MLTENCFNSLTEVDPKEEAHLLAMEEARQREPGPRWVTAGNYDRSQVGSYVRNVFRRKLAKGTSISVYVKKGYPSVEGGEVPPPPVSVTVIISERTHEGDKNTFLELRQVVTTASFDKFWRWCRDASDKAAKLWPKERT